MCIILFDRLFFIFTYRKQNFIRTEYHITISKEHNTSLFNTISDCKSILINF